LPERHFAAGLGSPKRWSRFSSPGGSNRISFGLSAARFHHAANGRFWPVVLPGTLVLLKLRPASATLSRGPSQSTHCRHSGHEAVKVSYVGCCRR
jgi:hypothetical protein